jgi:hypothetical protein
MGTRKPVLGPGLDRQPDGRPVLNPSPIDPRKIGTRGRKLLPQLPHVTTPTRIRHTAVPRRGSR